MKNPFGELGVDISPSELRETAYEILVGACRSSGSGRRLTYVSSSNRAQQPLSPSPSAASKVKKALGLKSKKKKSDEAGLAVGQLIRVQMRISEQTDSRIRRGFLRLAAGQLGKRIESMVLPLELLQHIRSSDFTNEREYYTFQKRNLKLLEAGLLFHPHLPLDNSETAPQRLRQILQATSDKPLETEKHSESMRTLHNVVTSLASRSFDGSISDICHWADGIPLNLHLYRILLEACFDVNDEASVIEEIDEVLEQIKKTWVILGMDQVFHNLCFLWVLFTQYLATGETENDLLCAADHMMLELVNDANSTRDPEYLKILMSTVKLILDWAEKILHRYHDVFYRVNIDVMQIVLSLGVSAARLLVDISHGDGKKRKEVDVAWSRVDEYIRLSVRNAFSQASLKNFFINHN